MASSDAIACRIAEVECKSVLNKSALADYTVNCYAGCEHGCLYCYARFATRFSHPRQTWGTFVDVKANAPEVLAREARRKRMGRVFVSSVCDGWQPLESDYRLTRRCLEILLRHGFPVTVLTKSALARCDLDLLASKTGVEFGVTVTTLDEDLRRLIEPRSSPAAERLAVLEDAARKGIRTYAFVGPLLPYLSDGEESLGPLLRTLRDIGVAYFYVDRLNLRFGVWPSLKGILQECFPHLVGEYHDILYHGAARSQYSERLRSTVSHLARRRGLDDRIRLCF